MFENFLPKKKEAVRSVEEFSTEDLVDRYVNGSLEALEQISKRPDAYEAIARKKEAFENALRQLEGKTAEQIIEAQQDYDTRNAKLEELQVKLAAFENPKA